MGRAPRRDDRNNYRRVLCLTAGPTTPVQERMLRTVMGHGKTLDPMHIAGDNMEGCSVDHPNPYVQTTFAYPVRKYGRIGEFYQPPLT